MRSFTFFINERSVLCILFGFISHTKIANLVWSCTTNFKKAYRYLELVLSCTTNLKKKAYRHLELVLSCITKKQNKILNATGAEARFLSWSQGQVSELEPRPGS